jgi:hypothetical protein
LQAVSSRVELAKLHATSTLKETTCKFNSQRNCMQVQLSMKLHASSTLKETTCKFNKLERREFITSD